MKRHLLEAADLDRDDATLVLDTAAQIDQALSGREVKKLPTLRGRTVVNLFYEDSTRTRISFELAAKRLSADVINFSAKGSSVSKGESLKDTALTLEAMGADAVVVAVGKGTDGPLPTPGAEAVDRLLGGRLFAALADLGARGGEDEVTRLATTIETWWPAILAFLHTGLTNARTEGYNRLVKQVKRVACGFRNTENSRRRIRFHCTRAQRANNQQFHC